MNVTGFLYDASNFGRVDAELIGDVALSVRGVNQFGQDRDLIIRSMSAALETVVRDDSLDGAVNDSEFPANLYGPQTRPESVEDVLALHLSLKRSAVGGSGNGHAKFLAGAPEE